MYYSHFGLIRPPFRIVPDPTLFFSGADRGSMLEALAYVVLSGEGITKVIGEVGSGKTMLCRMLEEKLPHHVETIYIGNPNISPENILNVITFEAGIVVNSGNKMELMQAFQKWLLQCHANNRRVIVLIEEAQSMPIETLEEIRLLSNLETGRDKLMQIVLFGQPELDEKLEKPEIRQLQDRIAHNFYLSPLSREEVREYTNFRMRQAGYHGPDLFNEKVVVAMTRSSKGLIRRINILADKVLITAYSQGTTRLSKSHVRAAVQDSKFTDSRRPVPLWVWVSGGVVVGVITALLLSWALLSGTMLGPTSYQVKLEGQTVSAIPKRIVGKTVSDDTLMLSGADRPDSVRTEARGKHTPISGDNDVLAKRLAITREWLNEADRRQYSIQLMTVKGELAQNLDDYLRQLPNSVDINDIFVYRAELTQGSMLGVLYQTFDSRKAALERMDNMPAAFNDNRPFMLRSVQGLRNEIANYNG